MARQLKVISWNANGVATKRNELHYFATDHDADVILLSETHLQQPTLFSLPAYQCYRSDRAHRPQGRNPGGGTAALVHRRLTHRAVDLPVNSIESTGVMVCAEGVEILLVAAYIPPGTIFQAPDLHAIFDTTQGPVVVAGDLNAKHPSWHSRVANRKGRALREFLDRRPTVYVDAPVEPTHCPFRLRGIPDVLDIVLFQELNFPLEVRAVDDLSSDHAPLLISIATNPACRNPPWASATRTDWARYHGLLSGLTPPPPAASVEELDGQVADLHATLADAVNSASKPATQRATRSELPPHLRTELTKRRKLRRAWQRTRSPAAKRLFNLQNALVKMLLDDYRTETWDTYLASLDVEDGSAWKAARILRGAKPASHPLHGQQGLVYAASDKAEAFANTMEDQFQPHAAVFNEDHVERMEIFCDNYFSEPPEDQIEPFTLQEVSDAVAAAKPRKAPGLDRVGARALQAAPPVLLVCMLAIFNSALKLCHFPDSWKTAKIILIPKPGKSPLFPQNYRPISLLPVISKLFERLLLARLSPFLDGFIRPEQFGFRRGHSTTLQLIRVLNRIVDNTNLNLATVSVLLDVSKAFDRVWHEGLLFKLSDTPLPAAAVHLLRSYLTGRAFRTFVEGELSTVRPIQAGVPQGSVLGPILYIVYTNDFPTVPGVTLSLYADDAMLTCCSTRPDRAATIMQRQMTTLSPWLEKWRISINTDKSDAIVFRKFRKMPRARPPPVTLNGRPIEWKDNVRYLGVTLDSRLNFGKHVSVTVDKARKIRGMITPLLNKRCPLPVRVKTTMFLLVVRSLIMYASTAWWALTSRSNRKKLEACQSRALRVISRQPWFVRNATIRSTLQVPTLDQFAYTTATRLFAKAAESPFPYLQALGMRVGVEERHRPRPMAILDDPP